MPLRLRRELQHSIFSSSTSGAGQTIPGMSAVAGLFTSIYAFIITAAGTTAVTVTFQDNASSPVIQSQAFQFGATALPLVVHPFNNGSNCDPLFITSVPGLIFQINLSAAVQVNADIWWLQGV